LAVFKVILQLRTDKIFKFENKTNFKGLFLAALDKEREREIPYFLNLYVISVNKLVLRQRSENLKILANQLYNNNKNISSHKKDSIYP
jgi:hypothetical protein